MCLIAYRCKTLNCLSNKTVIFNGSLQKVLDCCGADSRGQRLTLDTSNRCIVYRVCLTVSVPVSEVVAVMEGQVEIQPQKKVKDTDRDFTRKFQPGDADHTTEPG